MAEVAESLNSRIQLRDGYHMPMFGLGMNMCSEAGILSALQNGYRLLDAAEYYQNEEDVGKAIRCSGVPREDIFVVSKLWNNGAELCRRHVENSLKNMGLEYIDLYLIHTPAGGKNIETYRVMLQLQQTGKIRSLGVSNFAPHHLHALEEAGLPRPVVNQIELNSWQRKEETVAYCRNRNIAVMGYCPMAKGEMFNETWLKEIAARYGKSQAQVLIRWSVQKGYITIPKSNNPARISQNADVFDWVLGDDDLHILDSQPKKRFCWLFTDDPCTSPWLG